MGRNRTIEGFGGFLQGFAQALQQGLALRQRREENELAREEHRADRKQRAEDRDEDRELRKQNLEATRADRAERYRERDEDQAFKEKQFEETKRHHGETEKISREKGAAGGAPERPVAAEQKIRDRLFYHWNKGNNDPDKIWEEEMKPRKYKVKEIPAVMRKLLFKDSKPDDEVTIGYEQIEEAKSKAFDAELSMGDLTTAGIHKEINEFAKKKVTPELEREGVDRTELEAAMLRHRPAWEKRVREKTGEEKPQPGPESRGAGMQMGTGFEPSLQLDANADAVFRAALGRQSVQTRDGLVIDDISAAYAMRVSRDPQTSMMGKQLLATRGYPDVPSPFDMMDAQGNPSPGMMMAAQRDPEIMALVQAQQQTQQQMQPGAQTQQSQPASRPQMGRTGPTGGMLNQNPQIKKGTPPGSRPSSQPAPKRYQQGSGYGSGRGQ